MLTLVGSEREREAKPDQSCWRCRLLCPSTLNQYAALSQEDGRLGNASAAMDAVPVSLSAGHLTVIEGDKWLHAEERPEVRYPADTWTNVMPFLSQ